MYINLAVYVYDALIYRYIKHVHIYYKNVTIILFCPPRKEAKRNTQGGVLQGNHKFAWLGVRNPEI
jgi:hypothetical protein